MDPLLLFAAAVGLVWGGVVMLRGSLITASLGVLLAVCCFGYEFVHFDVGPLPLTIDRLLLGLVIGMLVVQRTLGLTEPKPLNKADVTLIAFVGYLFVSMLCSDWQGFPKGQVGPLWRWVGGYFTPLILYWGAKQSRWTDRTAGIVQGSLAIFGIYLGVTAVLEITQQWSFVFPAYIADPKIGLHYGRARGPMVHGVSFGHYMGVCLLAAWLWIGRLHPLGRGVMIATLPVYFAGVFFSYTRSVWMGTGLGLCTLLLMTLQGRARNLVMGGIAAAGILVGATQADKIVGFQREQSAADTAESANMRVGFAYVSWMMFQDRPLFGFGFGRFPLDKLPYLDDRATDLNLEKLRPYVHHNTFLSLLTDTGLLGLGLFLIAMLLWIRNAWVVYRAPASPEWAQRQAVLMLGALGVYACQLMFHELSYTPIDNSLVFFLAGTASALVPQRKAVAKSASVASAVAYQDRGSLAISR
ncbi:MAG: O-antigen ligase family protein [Planctomycetia bacterium]|nr:O-antigen ligase family protein [Planctomycetia bacterium]